MSLHTATALVAALFVAACVFPHTVTLRLLLLASGIGLSALLLARRREPLQALPPIWPAFLLWGAWAALSTAWSVDAPWSRSEWRNEVFYAGSALWICFVAAQARPAPRVVAMTLTLAGVLACALALREFLRGAGIDGAGWHSGPGNHSSALLTLAPCLAVAAWYAGRLRRPAWIWAALGALAALLVVSAYSTLNRTIWIAFALQFFVLGALLFARAAPALRNRTKLALAAVGIVAVVGCSAAFVSVQAKRETAGEKPMQVDARFALWPYVIEHIKARPLIGHGFGRGVLRKAFEEHFRERNAHLWHAHNLFLDTLLQTGAVGLALLVLLFGAIVREGWRMARISDAALAACGMAILGIVAGMLMRNMTDTLLVRQNALLFWGTLGVLLGIGARKWRAWSAKPRAAPS